MSTPHRIDSVRRTAAFAVAAVLAAVAIVIIAADIGAGVSAQSGEQSSGYIIARRLDDDRIEFGWQTPSGARVFPRDRYFAQGDAPVGRWWSSSLVQVDGAAIGRINTRRLAVARIEFAFMPTSGERILPPSRQFSSNVERGRWVRSTKIDISAAPTGTPKPTGRYIQISAGNDFTCSLRDTGAAHCWGDATRYDYAAVPDGRYTAIDAGDWQACAIRDAGEAVCWGATGDVPDGAFTDISVGRHYACGLREDGQAECWGTNGYGWSVLDYGQADAPSGKFTAISAGFLHACGLREGGEVECWGSEGNGRSDPPSGAFTSVTVGAAHACGLRDGGAIACWGLNTYGQADPPSGAFTAVSAGFWHACAVRETGELECWGDDTYGQTDAPTGRYLAVAAGTRHTCAMRERGVSCWGGHRPLPPLPPPPTDTPQPSQGPRFSAVAVGGAHSCAVRDNGRVVCWGRNDYGQADAPVGRFATVSPGRLHTCGILVGGAISCWGRNDVGQTDAPAGSFTAVAAGISHTCAIHDTGSLACWGSAAAIANVPAGTFTDISADTTIFPFTCALRPVGSIACWWGNLGDSDWAWPNPSLAGNRFVAIAVGSDLGLALGDDGAVHQMNPGNSQPFVAGPYSAVSVGQEASQCALRATGALECFEPGGLLVVRPGPYTAVDVGYNYYCALRDTGVIECGWLRDSITPAVGQYFGSGYDFGQTDGVPPAGCPADRCRALPAEDRPWISEAPR